MQEAAEEMSATAPAKEKKVSEEHPELHHYTTRAGLQGIHESQSLWASVFDVMNDPGEFMYAIHTICRLRASKMKMFEPTGC